MRFCGGGIVAEETRGAVAGDGRDHASAADPADPVVARIGNVDQPGVHIDAGRCIQPGQGGGAVVTEKPTGAGSGDGADSSCCADPSNPVVSGVGDIYQSRRIDKNGSWGIELGVGSGTVVAGKTRRSSARDGGDRIAGGVDSANTWFPVSAMYSAPVVSANTPAGLLRVAADGAPVSPE